MKLIPDLLLKAHSLRHWLFLLGCRLITDGDVKQFAFCLDSQIDSNGVQFFHRNKSKNTPASSNASLRESRAMCRGYDYCGCLPIKYVTKIGWKMFCLTTKQAMRFLALPGL